nr:hypothetical protein [Lachnospira eligens]
MEQYKQEFIDFMVESDVLKFGDFTLKSGRKSPFFMNAGAYVTGHSLQDLVSIMQRLFMKHMVMILMYCSDQHIREFQSA